MNKIEFGNDLLMGLINKSWENETFKEQLLQSPEEAIENFLGKELRVPEGKKIIVEDQSDSNTIYVNIPRNFTTEDFELSDEQLENISGGDLFLGVCTVIGAAAAVVQIGDWIYEGYQNAKSAS